MTGIEKFRDTIQAHVREQMNDWMNASPAYTRPYYYQKGVVASVLTVPRLGAIRVLEEEVDNDVLWNISITSGEDEQRSMREWVEQLCIDAVLVHSRGKIRAKYFAKAKYEHVPHLLQSTAKSLVGTCYGVAVDLGMVDPNKLVSDYLPEVSGTMYEDATVQHLADMRVNLPFNDFFSFRHARLPTGDSHELMALSKSTMYGGWKSDMPIADYLRQYCGRVEKGLIRGHGATFNYCSLDTILMGFVIESATDQPFHEFLGRELFAKIGAAHDMLFTINRFGEPTGTEGGMCLTAGDMMRFAIALQEKVFSGQFVYDRIQTLSDETEIIAGQTNMPAFEEYLAVYPQAGVSHYSNYFYLATNPYNGVRLNIMLGIYGQVVVYSLEDDFVYVGQASYQVTTSPPIVAQVEAAYQLHRNLT